MLNKNVIFNLESNSYSQHLNSQEISPNLTESEIETFTDLDPHRNSMDIYLKLYRQNKKQSHIYKMIFYFLSLLFFTLGAVVYFNTTNWACSLYFTNCAFIKIYTYSLCLVFSITTLGISFFIRPERETVSYLFTRMKRTLKLLYKRRKIDIGFILDLSPETRKKRLSFRDHYDQALEKMEEQKDLAIHLLEGITHAPHYDLSTKEELIYQALAELQHKLNGVLHSFKQKQYLLSH